MIDVVQFKDLVVVPALKKIDLYSPAAAELVLGTAIQESRLQYLKQLGNGPALGLFQMEPNTFLDIWHNYLVYREALAIKVTQLAHALTPEAMVSDLLFSAAMCRVHYRRVQEPLPGQGDYEAQAAYWKEHYNTHMGAGTEEEYLENWYAHSGVNPG
jgi:hypothetical protein